MGWIGTPAQVCDPFRVDPWSCIRGFRVRSTPGYPIRPFQGRGFTGGDQRARLTAPAKILGNFHLENSCAIVPTSSTIPSGTLRLIVIYLHRGILLFANGKEAKMKTTIGRLK